MRGKAKSTISQYRNSFCHKGESCSHTPSSNAWPDRPSNILKSVHMLALAEYVECSGTKLKKKPNPDKGKFSNTSVVEDMDYLSPGLRASPLATWEIPSIILPFSVM